MTRISAARVRCRRVVGAWCAALALGLVGGAGAGCLVGFDGQETACRDGLDDDGDGLIDCEDPDCRPDPICAGTFESDCANNLDDDGDGDVDCADSDCAGAAACQAPPEDCDDLIDNDGDGLIDCFDPDCSADPHCASLVELQCTDGVDNDADGQTDCEDPDCNLSPVCTGAETSCDNGLDDDVDTYVDCADFDCIGQPPCQAGETSCQNGIDDDGNGFIDCDDFACSSRSDCSGDGWPCLLIVDCADRCDADLTCLESCRNGGCSASAATFEDLQMCVVANCLTPCTTTADPQTCRACTTLHCTAQVMACMQSDC